MPQDKKLTRQMINDALGKEKSSPEFLAILDILGKPIIEVDDDIVDYMWDNHGINIVLSYETGIFINIFFYPNGSTSEFEYINDRKSCTPICKEYDFDQNLTMQEVRDKYGEPDAEGKGYPGHGLLYRNINGIVMRFVFTNETELHFIMLGQRNT